MHLDIVTPERRLVSTDVTAVLIPGTDGDLTAMQGHAPVITTLRPGVLKVTGAGSETDYMVSGGFAEVTADSCTVLAERALPVSEMTQGIFSQMLAETRARIDAAQAANQSGPVDDLVKVMADLVAAGTHIGLDPNQANVLP